MILPLKDIIIMIILFLFCLLLPIVISCSFYAVLCCHKNSRFQRKGRLGSLAIFKSRLTELEPAPIYVTEDRVGVERRFYTYSLTHGTGPLVCLSLFPVSELGKELNFLSISPP